MTTIASRAALGEIQRRVNEHLKAAGPMEFARYFLPALVTGAEAEIHTALNDWHVRETRRPPGALDAFAAPRGHGKSTAGVEIPALYHVAYCSRRFVVIASDTATQAEERLATIVSEVENNQKLHAAFPELRPALDERGQLVKWTDRDVQFACGCRIIAVGAGKSVRGARKGAQRPDLLLLDDLEDETSVASDSGLEKRLRWILRVALGLASPIEGISALWVGTILSRAALLNKATGAALDEGQERPEWARAWTPHVFSAEVRGSEKRDTIVVLDVEDEETGQIRKVVQRNADGKPLTYSVGAPMWSELTRSDLARIRFKLGALSYAAEYLSDPVDDGTTMLAAPRIANYLNPTAEPLSRIVQLPGGRIVSVSEMSRAAALDPAYAEGDSNDPDLAAIVVAGAYAGETFLLDAWLGRDPHGQHDRLVGMAVQWECYAAGVESVAAQATTASAAALDGRVPIIRMTRDKAKGGKVRRALSLAVRLGDKDRPETSRVWALPGYLRDFPESGASAVQQLVRFPHGRYDDAVDATVDAVAIAHRAVPFGGADDAPLSG